MNNKILIIPGCTDLNRGDQALTWETIRLAQEAGLHGEYYMMSGSDEDSVKQSKREGISIIKPLLKHPSRAFKSNNNIRYGLSLKLKWGIISLRDLLVYGTILLMPNFKFIRKFVSKEDLETLKVFEESSAVFVKGGGFLHAFGGIVSTYYMFFMLYHIKLALKLRKNVYIMPNSFGPFKGPFVSYMAKSVLSKCNVVLSRESISSEMIFNELKIKTQIMPDLGFFLEAKNREEMKMYMINMGIPLGEKKCVAMTMRPYRFPGSPNPEESYESYKQAFIDLIKKLDLEGFHIILVEHTLSKNSHENDGSTIKDIIPFIKECNYTFISDNNLSCRELKSIYSHCDYMIGTRFHSVIFSISEGVPAIAVTYGGNKGNGIMKDMGLSEYAIPIESVSFENLLEKFMSLHSNSKTTKEKISMYLAKARMDRNNLVGIIAEMDKI